ESEVGVGSVSAAVCDRHGRPVAGISVSAPLTRMDDERRAVLAEAVQRTCRAAAATLPLARLTSRGPPQKKPEKALACIRRSHPRRRPRAAPVPLYRFRT